MPRLLSLFSLERVFKNQLLQINLLIPHTTYMTHSILVALTRLKLKSEVINMSKEKFRLQGVF